MFVKCYAPEHDEIQWGQAKLYKYMYKYGRSHTFEL